MCPNCHAAFDRGFLREFEFVDYLRSLMSATPGFRNVASHVTSGDFGADLAADERTNHVWRRVLVQCKAFSAITPHRFDADLLPEAERYVRAAKGASIALAIPAVLSADQKELLAARGVQAWDLPVLAGKFGVAARQVPHPLLQPLLTGFLAQDKSVELTLIDDVQRCPAGREHWSLYQKLVGRIFERLFCGPLSSPISERSDDAKVNRRDWIFPNYAEDGFWAFLRVRYGADFIVVDAKNRTEGVRKAEALQVCNYLKEHGAGNLGFIVCRKAAKRGCTVTLREQWALHRKMVVVLTDAELISMLQAKNAGLPPEAVIQQMIENFRLSQ